MQKFIVSKLFWLSSLVVKGYYVNSYLDALKDARIYDASNVKYKAPTNRLVYQYTIEDEFEDYYIFQVLHDANMTERNNWYKVENFNTTNLVPVNLESYKEVYVGPFTNETPIPFETKRIQTVLLGTWFNSYYKEMWLPSENGQLYQNQTLIFVQWPHDSIFCDNYVVNNNPFGFLGTTLGNTTYNVDAANNLQKITGMDPCSVARTYQGCWQLSIDREKQNLEGCAHCYSENGSVCISLKNATNIGQDTTEINFLVNKRDVKCAKFYRVFWEDI